MVSKGFFEGFVNLVEMLRLDKGTDFDPFGKLWRGRWGIQFDAHRPVKSNGLETFVLVQGSAWVVTNRHEIAQINTQIRFGPGLFEAGALVKGAQQGRADAHFVELRVNVAIALQAGVTRVGIKFFVADDFAARVGHDPDIAVEIEISFPFRFELGSWDSIVRVAIGFADGADQVGNRFKIGPGGAAQGETRGEEIGRHRIFG